MGCHFLLQYICVVVQLLSHVQLFVACQASLSFTISQPLLKLKIICVKLKYICVPHTHILELNGGEKLQKNLFKKGHVRKIRNEQLGHKIS